MSNSTGKPIGFWGSFFASFLAILTHIVIVSFFFGVIIVGVLYYASSSSSMLQSIKDDSILQIQLSGIISDRTNDNPYENLLFEATETKQSLEEIIAAIRTAKNDDRIKGIYLKTGVMHTGYASLEEIRKALQDFQTSGKFIYSYSGSYTQGAYYVASVSDSVFLNPMGVLDLHGVSSSSMFYKHLLDTLGVEMQVIKVGTYKSFTEQYTNDTMSSENKEQVTRLVSTLWNELSSSISKSRNLEREWMDSLANDMITYKMPTQSLKAGLIDGLLYSDEVEKTLKNRLSVAEDDDLNLVSLQDYYNIEISGSTVQKSAPHVAILYLEGEIDNGNQDGISSSKTMKEIEKLRKDENVKSVVVRVNSPGGSAYGAEQIWHAIEELKKSKPVTVSMGNYAASGGYYLSAGANRIFANNNTITGSIGVFSVIPNLEGLMNKLGVKTQVVKTNPYADLLGNVARPLDEHEKEVLQEHVGEVYDMFLTRCSTGRSMPKPDVEKVAEGRVWVGQDAHSISLVDEIGTLDDAVKYAAKTANLPVDCPVVGYPEKKDFFSQLTELPHIGYDRIFKGSVLTKERKVFDKLSNMDYVQAAMPFSIELK